MACTLKVANMGNGCENGCGSKKTDWRNGEQDFPLLTLFHDLTDFSLKLFKMILKEP